MKPQRQDKPSELRSPHLNDDLNDGPDGVPSGVVDRLYPPAPVALADTDGDEPAAKKEKPTHYKVVCISLYNEDIERLETMVAELKRRGHTKANKSQLIRAALAQVDLSKIPKGF